MKRDDGDCLEGKKNAVFRRILPVMFHIYFQDSDSNDNLSIDRWLYVLDWALLRNTA